MLDSFEIVTTSGVVLWSKSYAPVGPSIINSLIRDVFIEEKIPRTTSAGEDVSATRNPAYKKEKYTLKWTTANDLGLIFVAVYQSLIHLSWIDKLLDNVKTIFTTIYRDQFSKPLTTVIDCPFDEYFDRLISEAEKSSGAIVTAGSEESSSAAELTPVSSVSDGLDAPPIPGLRAPFARQADTDPNTAEATPVLTPDSSRPSTPQSHLLTAKAGPGAKQSRNARRAAQKATSSARDSSANKKAEPSKIKKGRKWGDDGAAMEDDDTVLDYSATSEPSGADLSGPVPEAIASDTWGKKTNKGEFVLKDLDEEMNSILSSASARSAAAAAQPSTLIGSATNSITSLFRNVIGGKTLTPADLAKPLKGLEDHLIGKNVSREAAVALCSSVSAQLLGTTTASFQSIDAALRSATEVALSKILTPSSSLDILRSIGARSPTRPYVMSVVGVNGVGKSTTLAKLAFLLLHNNLRVLVCAADTFRSGAVEQLRVHVRNLQALTQVEDLGHIDLFERGYGKDAAQIAREAVTFASGPLQDGRTPYDVVLIDTAGRRHNDARLMSSLEPFARLANPDRILMVGEALVGNDSVAQARHFNEAFGQGRRLDGFVVSKCDTVGEMVGTLVSLVYATGVPIVAVGVGQHYGDLRGFNVKWARDLLLSS